MRHRLGLATRTKSPFPRHRSVPVPCENGSAETTVAEVGRNPVAGSDCGVMDEWMELRTVCSYFSSFISATIRGE